MNSTDLSVLKSAVSWLKTGHPVAIATVVQTWGSAPRPVGSWLAIRQDGQVAGSVSGGCVEDDLISRVQTEILTRNTPEMVVYGVSQEEAARFGLPCGGTLRLLVEPKPQLVVLEKLLEAISSHQPLVLAARRHAAGSLLPAAYIGSGPGTAASTLHCFLYSAIRTPARHGAGSAGWERRWKTPAQPLQFATSLSVTLPKLQTPTSQTPKHKTLQDPTCNFNRGGVSHGVL